MAPQKSDRRQQEKSDALVATVNAFLTVGLFAPLGQAHDELKANSSWLPLGRAYTRPWSWCQILECQVCSAEDPSLVA